MSRRRRRDRRVAPLVRALVVLAAFVLGVAVGAALDEAPQPGTTTYERTLTVVTVAPQP